MNQKKAKEQGWDSTRLVQLIENVRAYAIISSDPNGELVSWNCGAEAIFGYSAEEAIGMKSDMLFTPEDRFAGVPESERQTALDEGSAQDERWHVRKDGSRFFASGVQTALFDDDGTHIGFAKIVRDLTDRVELENKLSSANEEMEIKVVERTSELERSNEHLRHEVVERIRAEELRLAMMRKIVATQEKERKRIARDLHDEVGQQMTALQLKLNAIVAKEDPNCSHSKEIAEIQAMANQIDRSIDFLAWELRPSVLDDLGLPLAAKRFVRDWSAHFGVAGEFHDVGMRSNRLLPEIEINLYRIIQEALNNISKHARAKFASVLLERRDGNIRLIIEDDGAGFETEQMKVSKTTDRGMGLVGMRERAELLGGRFELESTPGKGTTVYVNVPVIYPDGEPSASPPETGA